MLAGTQTPPRDRERETSAIPVVLAKTLGRKIISEISTGQWTRVEGVQDYISVLFTMQISGDCVIELCIQSRD